MNNSTMRKLRTSVTKHLRAYKIAVAEKLVTIGDKRLIAGLLEGVSDPDSVIVRACLNNQVVAINSNIVHKQGDTVLGNKKVMMQLSKELILQILTLQKVIGIQPLLGPVGLVYTLQLCDSTPLDNESNHSVRTLAIISNAVQAGTRKLDTQLTIEVAQDMLLSILNFEREFTSTIAAACFDEYAAHVVDDLVRVAGETLAVSPLAPNGEYGMCDHVLVAINQVANNLAASNRRGAGNVLIMSPSALTVVSMSKHFCFVKDPDDTACGTMLRRVGHAGGTSGTKMWTVYTSLAPQLSQDGIETMIVGYKGYNETDTAYILSPYIPLVASGVLIDPRTFTPTISLRTRYGQFIANGSDNPLFDVKNYYRLVTFPTPTEPTTQETPLD